MDLLLKLSFFVVGCISLVEVKSLRQLDQHFRETLEKSDSRSTPFTRITRLFHKYKRARSTSRKHVSIINQTVTANGSGRNHDSHVVIESHSFGTIKLHSLMRPVYYICIGADYKPRGVAKKDLESGVASWDDCIFKEYSKRKYVQFKSVKYFDKKRNTGCLAFNKRGRGKRINKSKCGCGNSKFIDL